MRRVIGNLLCLVGWHDWFYSRAPKNALTIGWTGYYRNCKRCRAHEVEERRHEWR